MKMSVRPPICPECRIGRHWRCDQLCECPSRFHADDGEPYFDPDEEYEIQRWQNRYERWIYGEMGDMP